MPFKYSLIPEHSHPTANAILIAWPYPNSDWQGNLDEAELCYSNMLDAFYHHCSVIVLLHPSIKKLDWFERYKDKPCLINGSVHVINTVHYNDTWVRDYGPLSVVNIHDTAATKPLWMRFNFNGWGNKYASEYDNNASTLLAEALGQAIIERDYTLEGGALEVNQQRVLLANKTCLLNANRNQYLTLEQHESIIAEALNIKHFAWLDVPPLTGDDTDGHIDTLARFASDDHIVYTQPNPAHPDNNTLLKLESQLIALAYTYSWTLTGLPTPQVYDGSLATTLLPATYANFLIVGSTVFMPFYGVKSDKVAFNILKNVFSRYNLVSINSRALLDQCGSLHCATMQLTL